LLRHPITLVLAFLFVPLAAQGREKPLPPVTEETPAPGRRVKQIAPAWKDTQVYHLLYLPTDWAKDKRYPVIVEYPGNNYPPLLEGKVEDCKLGYYQSGGAGFLWVVLPFVNAKERKNQPLWWGDVDATVAYCKINLRRICETYGGDPSAIFLTGFSRGAIACGYIGLHDDTIADIWLGFLPFSHHDGGSFTRQGAKERLARIKGRASFISWGEKDGGRANSLTGKKLLDELRFPVTVLEIPKIGHTDEWIVRDSPERKKMRAWLGDVRAKRPGTFSISGKVVDKAGRGVKDVRIDSGWHWTHTDARGEYQLRGLVGGKRSLSASAPALRLQPVRQDLDVDRDLAGRDFVAAK
jgi:predicted esterase